MLEASSGPCQKGSKCRVSVGGALTKSVGTLFHCMEKHGVAARCDSMTLQSAPFE